MNIVSKSGIAALALRISNLECGILINSQRPFSSSSSVFSTVRDPEKWPSYNEKIFPPQQPDEEKRPAFVCHMKTHVKYSYKKMWYIATMVRGLQVDEAINQLKFVNKKGSQIAIDTLQEAKELAVKEHNVEYATNLWVAESFAGKALVIKGYRRHAKGRMGEVRYGYIHYFVRLEEGTPPEHYYYYRRPLTPQEKLDNWLKEKRERIVTFTH